MTRNEAMTRLQELMREALDCVMSVKCDEDEYTKHSIYDELHNEIINVLHFAGRVEALEDTKNTKEIVYLTTEYRYSEVEKRMFLVTHFAHSLHELNESHIYEVTAYRSKETNPTPKVDYIHKAIIIADFDMTNCPHEDYKSDFRDELFDAIFDCRFNTINSTIKQLS
jgi:hypothetical protein